MNCFEMSNDLSMCNLPCHLRDDKWLTKMLRKNQKLFYLKYNQILNYVKTSEFFNQKRHDYEMKIVKWQIYWMKNGGENWIIDEKYGDLCLMTPFCDLAFRKGVVDTLSAIGMDREVIEEGIEKNSNIWRNIFIEMAFSNEFEPVFYRLPSNNLNNSETNVKKLEPVDPEHKDKWIKMRKYEYYQNHKSSVDKYGVVEPEMILYCEEVKELTTYLNYKNSERKYLIEQYKKEMYNSIEKTKVLKK